MVGVSWPEVSLWMSVSASEALTLMLPQTLADAVARALALVLALALALVLALALALALAPGCYSPSAPGLTG